MYIIGIPYQMYWQTESLASMNNKYWAITSVFPIDRPQTDLDEIPTPDYVVFVVLLKTIIINKKVLIQIQWYLIKKYH